MIYSIHAFFLSQHGHHRLRENLLQIFIIIQISRDAAMHHSQSTLNHNFVFEFYNFPETKPNQWEVRAMNLAWD